MSTDLENLFFDCRDVPMQHNEIPISGSLLRTPETGSNEITTAQRGQETHDPWHDYNMQTAESLIDLGKLEVEEAKTIPKDSEAQNLIHSHDTFAAGLLKGLAKGKPEESDAVQKAEEAQHTSEDSEPEFEEGGPSQKHQATERKREYKRKFDR
ncbi:MAG: hypothetical protein Q9184_005043 [Pyrenodesmia sp. 2 TL-2023]